VDRVYIALPIRAEDRIRDLLEKLSDVTLGVYLVPDIFALNLLLGGRMQRMGDLCTLSVFGTPHHGLRHRRSFRLCHLTQNPRPEGDVTHTCRPDC